MDDDAAIVWQAVPRIQRRKLPKEAIPGDAFPLVQARRAEGRRDEFHESAMTSESGADSLGSWIRLNGIRPGDAALRSAI